MGDRTISRRSMLGSAAGIAGALAATSAAVSQEHAAGVSREGSQRLTVERLKKWEALGYGMFIHYGLSTFVQVEQPTTDFPVQAYAPTELDVDQWISVARDAGMKYAMLTAKHVSGHCLWPSKFTDYSVANSTDKTDVIAKYVEACAKRGVLPGLYYCTEDNHTRMGSRTRSDKGPEPAYTTSLYQTYVASQVTELLTQYGPIAEIWIDIPGMLGRGFRTYLYERIADLQPDTIIMMNNGYPKPDGSYDVDYAWPSDIMSIERGLPPESGHKKWWAIEGNDYYLPGEVCDTIGEHWFFVDGDMPKADEALTAMRLATHAAGANLLLDVPPDKRGRIPQYHVDALMRLQKSAGIS
ncbi:MAG: alpha-L-fucosidase [Candidatus Hydrogenedentes bacterium]|nr:alpha-L-fucosidase [Candidatus Hydrogenedentota bacterium]